MTEFVAITVDGRHGTDVAREQPAQEEPTELGSNGRDASDPVPGGPAGQLAVELSESVEQDGYLHAVVVRWESWQQPIPAVEVPPGQDIMLSAVGGNAEDGRVSGNGLVGVPGVAGLDATRETDATDGSDGGNGGNAGSGTDGANGGPGGAIQILLRADSTHLLFALRYEVGGGSGGRAGRHGEPGEGGIGGVGGEGVEWKQHLGWKYYCTPDCVGKGDSRGAVSAASASALVRTNSLLLKTGTHLRTAIGSELVRGGNLETAITQIALKYQVRRERRVELGLCKCAGGTGNCHACDSEPLERLLHRNPAQPGKKGRTGLPQSRRLRDGLPGPTGEMSILVRNVDGTTNEYQAPWKLRLVSFDVEDENGDGIFEPGEHVLVRRIRVCNVGGMPSPLQGSRLQIQPSDDFEADDEAQLFIPSSIPADTTVTLEGSLRARIRTPREAGVIGTRYVKEGVKIKISATVPWLDRLLPDFDLERSFDVQYPCAISNTDVLASVAPGSCSNLTWEVTNFGNKAIGGDAAPSREVQIEVILPAEYGTLANNVASDAGEITMGMPIIGPKASGRSSQTLTISRELRGPTKIQVTLGLYISDPSHGEADDGTTSEAGSGLVLVHTVQVVLQVSDLYQYNPNSKILMVVNSQTPPQRLLALRRFIEGEMGVTADVWDVELNGGWQADVEGQAVHVLRRYRGKTILLAGEECSFFGTNKQTVTELCDPEELHDSLDSRSSHLFLGLQGGCGSLFRQSVFAIPGPFDLALNDLPHSARFETPDALAKAISQQDQSRRQSANMFALPVRKRWYHILQRPSSERQARATARRLRKSVPQIRFLVTTIEGSSKASADNDVNEKGGPGFGQILILSGCDRSVAAMATEKTALPASRAAEMTTLERYTVVASLAAAERARLLWSDSTSEGDDFSFVTRSAICSLALDCANDLAVYAYSAFQADCTGLPLTGSEAKAHLRTHLPNIAAVLLHTAAALYVPQAVMEVLTYCLAACRPQNLTEVCVPGGARRTLYKHLRGLMDELLAGKGTNRERIAGFHQQVDTLHSKWSGAKRNTHSILVQRAARLTGTSDHAFTRSSTSANEVVPDSVVCSAQDWNTRFSTTQATSARIRQAEQQAHKTIKEKIVTLPSDIVSPVELAQSTKTEAEYQLA